MLRQLTALFVLSAASLSALAHDFDPFIDVVAAQSTRAPADVRLEARAARATGSMSQGELMAVPAMEAAQKAPALSRAEVQAERAGYVRSGQAARDKASLYLGG